MTLLLAAVVSCVLAFFLRGSCDKPSRYGGLAVLAGLLIGVYWSQGPAAFFTLRVYWFSLGILFLMGVVDDVIPLRPWMKLTFQVLAVSLFLVFTPASVMNSWTGIPWVGAPLLLFWLIGITNALNLLDNMDGLAPGVGAIIAVGIAFSGLGSGNVLLHLSCALAGFLIWNFFPGKIYLGDAGSHLVGFTLAAMSLYSLNNSNCWVPVGLLLVPICDTTFVSLTRLLRGVSPFEGGKDHLSHRLVAYGFSVRTVVLSFYVVTALLVLVILYIRA